MNYTTLSISHLRACLDLNLVIGLELTTDRCRGRSVLSSLVSPSGKVDEGSTNNEELISSGINFLVRVSIAVLKHHNQDLIKGGGGWREEEEGIRRREEEEEKEEERGGGGDDDD